MAEGCSEKHIPGNMLWAFPAPLTEERLGDTSLGPLAPFDRGEGSLQTSVQIGCKVFSGQTLGLRPRN